ncbi:MAG TPA: HYR domain-containing protein, partial [Nitrososphaeraceae archaeon]
MNSKLFFSVSVLSIAFILVVFLDPSALIVINRESVVPTTPITKFTPDTKSFLETVEGTTSPIDATPPVVSVPDDIIAEATGPEGRIVNYEANATDNVDGNLATVCNPKSGSIFALGQTKVECTATDNAGNIGKNEFIITVRDTTPPETMLGNVTVGWLGSITSGGTTPSVDTNFDFNGTDLVGISHYECRLDNGEWNSAHTSSDISGEEINICTYTGVRNPGSHNFQVRAVDTSGNKDPSPPSFMWNIESPPEAIQGLITQVNSIYQSLDLDPPLRQAVEDLSDTPTSDDANSCYLLNSFMNEIKVQNMIGSLSLTDLNDFATTTLAIMDN